jgi:hypothetical protein
VTNCGFHPPGAFWGLRGSNLVVFGGDRRPRRRGSVFLVPSGQDRFCGRGSLARGQGPRTRLCFAVRFASHFTGLANLRGFSGVIYLCFVAKMQVHFFRAAASQNILSPDEFGCDAISQQ